MSPIDSYTSQNIAELEPEEAGRVSFFETFFNTDVIEITIPTMSVFFKSKAKGFLPFHKKSENKW